MKRNQFVAFNILLSFFLLLGCKSEPEKKEVERPREAWVVRSVLDLKPRMLSVALNENLWVAYNTQTGGLYKAWSGTINFEGAVYTAAHGPQPTSEGITFMEEPDGNPWVLKLDGKEVTPDVVYRGHSTTDNKATLKYDLVHNGHTIQIEEQPEYFEVQSHQSGFERRITASNVPSGAELALKVNLSSILSENDLTTDGTFNIESKEEETFQNRTFSTVRGRLILNPNGTTVFSTKFTPRPTTPSEGTQEGEEEKVIALFASSDCNTCHNVDVKTVGPSYKAVAEKYPNNTAAKEQLIKKVIKGGAGNWGEVPMTPHPDLSKEDAATMVSYILSLDGEEEKQVQVSNFMPDIDYKVTYDLIDPKTIDDNEERPGIAMNIYQFTGNMLGFPKITSDNLPISSGVANVIHADENGFGNLESNFSMVGTGFINLKEPKNIVFRLVSDDGSRLFINDQLIIDNGGFHGLDPKDGEVQLKAGKHPFKIEYFQAAGGKGFSFQWMPHGAQGFEVVPPEVFTFKGADINEVQESPLEVQKRLFPPGDTYSLDTIHPSFDLAQVRPEDFQPKVGGMDFLSDGRLVISTWDSVGAVFILDGVQGKKPTNIKVKQIAFGLAEPLGIKVVDDVIFVMQKQELTKLVDHNGDDVIDEYQTICNGWRVSSNFHEFAFGLLYEDGFFYGTLATAINPGGASTQPQIPDRGKVIKINKDDGSFEFMASGLRTPNGIGYGVDKEIFIADNQGDWLPASKIVHFQPNAWYGSRSVDFEGTANLTETLPVVWLPQDEIGNSPSQPAPLNIGPYKNQMIHGEVTHGGIKRVFTEKINGQYQGVVFRFTQGLEAGINRIVWGPDGALYVGGVGSSGNWNHAGKKTYGLQKLTFNDKTTFEMLAVRAKPDGIEIEFTEPLKEGTGKNGSDYTVKQWYYKPTEEYGGPKMDERNLKVASVTLSEDRRRAYLKLNGMKPKHLVYIHLNRKNIMSEKDQSLWSTEAWYTMNNIPGREIGMSE